MILQGGELCFRGVHHAAADATNRARDYAMFSKAEGFSSDFFDELREIEKKNKESLCQDLKMEPYVMDELYLSLISDPEALGLECESESGGEMLVVRVEDGVQLDAKPGAVVVPVFRYNGFWVGRRCGTSMVLVSLRVVDANRPLLVVPFLNSYVENSLFLEPIS